MDICPKKKLNLFRCRDMPQPIPRDVLYRVGKFVTVKPIITILSCVEAI
jgi:hypothetical protein